MMASITDMMRLLFLLPLLLPTPATATKRISVVESRAVIGGEAQLACDVTRPRDDDVFLVLWFNDYLTTPIYSYDGRPGSPDSPGGSHWLDSSVLADRAGLILTDTTARLSISPVRRTDEGLYKCRVDFRRQATKTTRVALRVIVPPRALAVSEGPRQGLQGVLGPYTIGATTTLSCTASHGSPPPKVVWYYNDQILDDQMDPIIIDQDDEDSSVSIHIPNLQKFINPENEEIDNHNEKSISDESFNGDQLDDFATVREGRVRGGRNSALVDHDEPVRAFAEGSDDISSLDYSTGGEADRMRTEAATVRPKSQGRPPPSNTRREMSDFREKVPMYRNRKARNMVSYRRRRRRIGKHDEFDQFTWGEVSFNESNPHEFQLGFLEADDEFYNDRNILKIQFPSDTHATERPLYSRFPDGQTTNFKRRRRSTSRNISPDSLRPNTGSGLQNGLPSNPIGNTNINDGSDKSALWLSNSMTRGLEQEDHHSTLWNSTYRNTVRLGPFSRSDLKSVVRCEASNSNLTAPLAAAFVIDMNLPPLTIKVTAPPAPLSAGRGTVSFTCSVWGSRPPPSITWWKGSVRVNPEADEISSSDGNQTSSVLQLAPVAADDGSSLTCKAANPATNTVLEYPTLLTVYFIPEVRISLGSSLEPEGIKEGDDVYFECSVTANPRAYKISWLHESVVPQGRRVLEHNPSLGVIVGERSLALQGVGRDSRGRYSCSASNIEGDGTSIPITLDVKFAPVCNTPPSGSSFGVARGEPAEVLCQVSSNPRASRFTWSFNNSADTVQVPSGAYTVTDNNTSIITYTPVTLLDYGTLLCYAENSLGRQKKPCVLHILPAGPPDAPDSCSVSNQTASSFTVSCTPGFDGGLRQHYILSWTTSGPFTQGRSGGGGTSTKGGGGKVAATVTAVVRNTTSDEPVFQVSGLRAATLYLLSVVASNERGTSSAFSLNGITTTAPAHHHQGPSEAEVRNSEDGTDDANVSASGRGGDTGLRFDVTEWIGVIAAGLTATVAVVAMVTVAVLVRMKVQKRKRSDGDENLGGRDGGSEDDDWSARNGAVGKVGGACGHRDVQVAQIRNGSLLLLAPPSQGNHPAPQAGHSCASTAPSSSSNTSWRPSATSMGTLPGGSGAVTDCPTLGGAEEASISSNRSLITTTAPITAVITRQQQRLHDNQDFNDGGDTPYVCHHQQDQHDFLRPTCSPPISASHVCPVSSRHSSPPPIGGPSSSAIMALTSPTSEEEGGVLSSISDISVPPPIPYRQGSFTHNSDGRECLLNGPSTSGSLQRKCPHSKQRSLSASSTDCLHGGPVQGVRQLPPSRQASLAPSHPSTRFGRTFTPDWQIEARSDGEEASPGLPALRGDACLSSSSPYHFPAPSPHDMGGEGSIITYASLDPRREARRRASHHQQQYYPPSPHHHGNNPSNTQITHHHHQEDQLHRRPVLRHTRSYAELHPRQQQHSSHCALLDWYNKQQKLQQHQQQQQQQQRKKSVHFDTADGCSSVRKQMFLNTTTEGGVNGAGRNFPEVSSNSSVVHMEV